MVLMSGVKMWFPVRIDVKKGLQETAKVTSLDFLLLLFSILCPFMGDRDMIALWDLLEGST